MYEGFFDLRSRPFLATPHTARYYPGAIIDAARTSLIRCIERGEGTGLIVGPAGTGKTLLCQLLAEHFADRFSLALLNSGRLATRQALLQAILYALGLPYRGMDEGELRLSLLDHLQPAVQDNEGLLLIVDEAHALPWRLLEEIRLLTNLVRDGQSRVRVILAGSSVLEERFASPKLSSFSQRLAARCYLESLDSRETADYVRAQIAAVAGDPAQLFHEEAYQSIYRATDGIGRLINQVCDHALILASVGGLRRLTSAAIEEAWADLQQLPSPWNIKKESTATASQVVEFGGLDDANEELPEAIPFRPASRETLHVAGAEEQLDAIEQHLSQLAGNKTAAAASETEAELDFPEFGDPFSEEFVEEEVVFDRYGSDVEIFAEVPRVSSWEGHQLGSILEQFELNPSRHKGPERPPVKVSLAELPPVAPIPYVAPTPFLGPTTVFVPAADPVMPEEPADPQVTVHEAMVHGRAPEQSDDRELIIVEDDPPAVSLTPRSAPIVRKMEYRQLFAKLRRG